MKTAFFPAIALICLLIASCKKDGTPAKTETFTFDFNNGLQNWSVGFADYNESHGDMELDSEIAALPAPLDTTKKGLKVQGHNRSDDLFMFIKHKVTGLAPNQNYRVKIELTFASNAPSGAVGVGGAPGESVFVKAGATKTEPLSTKKTDGTYEMNIDKGQQSNSGADMKVIGDVANGTDKFEYVSLTRNSGNQTITVKTDAQGACWLIAGTDSGFEGLTRLYYQQLKATLEPAD